MPETFSGDGFVLYWRGDDIKQRTETATQIALEALMRDCVEYAKSIAPFVTGRYRDGVGGGKGITYVLSGNGSKRAGSFGSDAPYGLFVEIGTSHMPGQYVIRRTADRLAPSLPQRVRSQLVT
jgi:hypothetical protein